MADGGSWALLDPPGGKHVDGKDAPAHGQLRAWAGSLSHRRRGVNFPCTGVTLRATAKDAAPERSADFQSSVSPTSSRLASRTTGRIRMQTRPNHKRPSH